MMVFVVLFWVVDVGGVFCGVCVCTQGGGGGGGGEGGGGGGGC